MATIEVDVDLESLAYDLAHGITRTALIKFIMTVDEVVAETEFTDELIDRLTLANLEAEGGS